MTHENNLVTVSQFGRNAYKSSQAAEQTLNAAIPGAEIARSYEEKNKALVLNAFDTLFNKRDYAVAERFWSPQYIQHSAHIAPGRDGLFDLIKSIPPTLKYEAGTIVAESNFVIVHGRFRDSARL